MNKSEINIYKRSIFNMYGQVDRFINTDTAEELNGLASFEGTNFYINGKRQKLDTTAIVLKKLKDLNASDLHILSTLSGTPFNNLTELSKFLNHHMLFKESIMFYNIFVLLKVALPYLKLSVAELEEMNIIKTTELI